METSKTTTAKKALIITGAFILGFILSYIVFTVIARSSQPVLPVNANTEHPTTSTQNTPSDLSITQSPLNPVENILSIKSLGLSFNYAKYAYSIDENGPGLDRTALVNVPKFDTTQGPRITFGPTYTSFMTVYQKQPTQSLESAITSQFLQGIPSTKCLAVRIQSGSDSALYVSTSTISYVRLTSTATFFSFASEPTKFFYAIGEADGTMPLTTATGDAFWTTMTFTN